MNIIVTPIQWISMAFVALVLLLCYAIVPYVGAGALMCIDNAAFGLRWLGFSTPMAEWTFIGAVVGGLIALNRSFRRIGMPDKTKVIVASGAGILICLYVMSVLYTQTMRPVYRTPQTPAATPQSRQTITIPLYAGY